MKHKVVVAMLIAEAVFGGAASAENRVLSGATATLGDTVKVSLDPPLQSKGLEVKLKKGSSVNVALKNRRLSSDGREVSGKVPEIAALVAQTLEVVVIGAPVGGKKLQGSIAGSVTIKAASAVDRPAQSDGPAPCDPSKSDERTTAFDNAVKAANARCGAPNNSTNPKRPAGSFLIPGSCGGAAGATMRAGSTRNGANMIVEFPGVGGGFVLCQCKNLHRLQAQEINGGPHLCR